MEGNNSEGQNIEYTVEMDVPSINHILNMYNYSATPTYNNTSNPNPLPIPSNYGHCCPADNISQMYENIEPLYVSEIKDMRNNVLDILNNRSHFNVEVEGDEGGTYENKEIDDLYEKIKNINEEFKVLQDRLYEAEDELKTEINKLNSNIKKLDNFIEFLKSLSTIEYEFVKVIIKNINDLSSKLSNVESFKTAKKKYETERKNILKYIYFLKKVNKMNVTNMCVVCMEEQVTHFINPCGHTFCKACLEKHLDVEDIDNIDTIHNDKKCPMCRKYVLNVNPLYFL